jgi:1-acyl-sn-glycerol-3-phosphate acyltransferase
VPDPPSRSWRIARATLGVAFEAAFRMRYAGLERLPVDGGALLAYNHVSVLDPFAVGLGALRRGRVTSFLAVADVFDRPVRGWVLRSLDMVPLNRGSGDLGAIENALRVLRGGGFVGIAPEGTVGTGDQLQRGHRGAARMSLLAHAPVIPVGVWGTQRRWPKEGFRLGPPVRPVAVAAFGPAVAPRGDPTSRSDVRALTDRVMEALALQVDEARALA